MAVDAGPELTADLVANSPAETFESMLAGWLRDPSGWPKNRTFKMFREWFETQMSSMVEDLDLDEPLEHLE